MPKVNKLNKNNLLNIEDNQDIENRLEKEYRNLIKKEMEDSDNQLRLEDSCVECYERMKEYILNCGLMIGQNLNCQNLINFVKPEKKKKRRVYKEYKLVLESIKK